MYRARSLSLFKFRGSCNLLPPVILYTICIARVSDSVLGSSTPLSLSLSHTHMDICQCEESQDVCSISVLYEKGNVNTPCPPKLAFLSFLQGLYPSKSYECLDVQWNCRNCIGSDKDSSCGVDIDVGNGYLEAQKTDEQTIGCQTKTESALMRVLPRKIRLQMGWKIVQHLLDYSLMLLKCGFREKSTSEKRSDTGTIDNRLRRYNRSASFNSRKIVLLSSILSSVGTLLLIYMTLRVKRNIDGLVYAA